MDARAERNDPAITRPRRSRDSEDSIEVRRYLDALRRNRWLILLLVALTTIGAVAVSLWLPKKYTASASIVKQVTAGPYDSVNVDSITRELQTIQRLLQTSSVLDQAARRLPGEDSGTLSEHVSSSVDPDANLLYVTATGGEPQLAADRANAVATAFVEEQREVTRRQYARARDGLVAELERVRNDPAANQQEAAIRQRLSELSVAQANAGSDLQVAQRAGAPGSPTSPRPLRNGVIAFFLALFLGVLVALGRDQLVPRVSGPRELGSLLDMPILATVPYLRRRLGHRRRLLSGIEYESYQTLGASVRFSLPPESAARVLLVTSALHAEGKSTVTARLGRALAQSGHPTLLVSADLRWPTLHELVEVPAAPGLSDLISDAEQHPDQLELDRLITSTLLRLDGAPRSADLDVLPSGTKPGQPAQLLTGEGTEAVFDRLRTLDYSYILVDAPPVLGISDTQSLARFADSLLWVSRLDRITLDNVMDARDILDRLEAQSIGLVVIGARSEASPYYVGVRTPALDES
jgi:capsular exopolysaccharide synthesis family protein